MSSENALIEKKAKQRWRLVVRPYSVKYSTSALANPHVILRLFICKC